jgi:hypothetical protein
MVRAFKLYTGPDNASHVLEGTIDENDRTGVKAIHFKETPAYSSYDWHPDPEPQFVITLSGTFEFSTPDGETFVLRPGDVFGPSSPLLSLARGGLAAATVVVILGTVFLIVRRRKASA